MQVILHTGAHETDEDRLLKCLLGNRDGFSAAGVSVPGPGKYRYLLGDAFKAMETAEPSDQARDVLVDAILDDEIAERMILSHPYFFGAKGFAVSGEGFYHKAPERLGQLRQLFAGDEVQVFMALRNPAGFLPALLGGVDADRRDQVLGAIDPRGLRWSDMVARMRAAVPDVRITLWCHEDSPLIWGQILREMAGLPEDAKVQGGFDLLAAIMSKEGMQRFRAYLHTHPDMTETQKRRVMMAFLDKYALEDELEEVLDLPGWTEALVEELTELYDIDLGRIAAMDGVRLIEP